MVYPYDVCIADSGLFYICKKHEHKIRDADICSVYYTWSFVLFNYKLRWIAIWMRDGNISIPILCIGHGSETLYSEN